MTFWGFCQDRCRLKWRCPLYKLPYAERLNLCKDAPTCSPSEYGRTIYIHPDWDYRLFTRIPRSSDLWKEKMKRRTSSERCNKRMKVDYDLEKVRVRSTKHWFVRTALVAMCQHIDAWYNERIISK
ncbi:MAG: transposase [bacterium]|nr:transposase [bacterium]